ncbi:unnamed protein product [Fraxinus pennsylvanica]|uniref:Integrase catalytic domain-containing protein n=1 Tax=Fraxinus pennsylvanica TaxID=56036 RepID=A0AAD1ZSE3_9LAMI|nr:unnamed protein product [Fraxinus pennsylvanica]
MTTHPRCLEIGRPILLFQSLRIGNKNLDNIDSHQLIRKSLSEAHRQLQNSHEPEEDTDEPQTSCDLDDDDDDHSPFSEAIRNASMLISLKSPMQSFSLNLKWRSRNLVYKIAGRKHSKLARPQENFLETLRYKQRRRKAHPTPLLSKPKDHEILHLYLAVTSKALSSVLIREENNHQLPVYYVSKALLAAETRYPDMEKLALSLVTSSRKLRPYFQAHGIHVLTNYPFKQVLQKPDASRRLLKWAVELSEFDITFKFRATIKGQTLANFIANLPLFQKLRKNWNPPNPRHGTSPLMGLLGHRIESMDHLVVSQVHGNFLVRDKSMAAYLKKDAQEFVRKCDKCQPFATIQRQHSQELSMVSSPWSFAKWGINLIGPLPMGGKVPNIICRFEILHSIVSDNGRQFDNKKVEDMCEELGIKKHFSSPHHHQTNGQVEPVNKTTKYTLKRKLDASKWTWVDELPQVLWAIRTTSRTATGETPFSMVYGVEATSPVEVGLASPRRIHFNEVSNGGMRRCGLDLLEERMEDSWAKMAMYQRKMTRYYNSKVKRNHFE